MLDARDQSEQSQIDSLTSQISDWTTRLTGKEQSYRQMFTSMEVALQQSQLLQQQLTAQLAQLPHP